MKTQISFTEYQAAAIKTLNSAPSYNEQLANFALGITSEGGEIAQRIRKALYQDAPLDREAVKLELGDLLWYMTNLASHLEIPLDEIASANITKLTQRHGNTYDPTEARRRAAQTVGQTSG